MEYLAQFFPSRSISTLTILWWIRTIRDSRINISRLAIAFQLRWLSSAESAEVSMEPPCRCICLWLEWLGISTNLDAEHTVQNIHVSRGRNKPAYSHVIGILGHNRTAGRLLMLLGRVGASLRTQPRRQLVSQHAHASYTARIHCGTGHTTRAYLDDLTELLRNYGRGKRHLFQ